MRASSGRDADQIGIAISCGNDIYDPQHGITAVQGGSRTGQKFNPVQSINRKIRQ